MAARKASKTSKAASSTATSKQGAVPHQGTITDAFGVDLTKFDHRSTNAAFKGSQVGTQAAGAKAYAAQGSIAFSKSAGQHTAAHELAHVAQQRSGR